MLMESYPYRIIEGIAIAAYTVGADEGKFYIRSEYPLAIKRVGQAIENCKRLGFLGSNIIGRGFSLHLEIVAGAGAFVCGEETALMASIEGRRGMPRLRPPYPAEHGLWGRPTLINNVETYAAVPWIIRNGAEQFANLGTAASKGTKVFALAGKIARGGLIEVPMGISIRQVVQDIGGGIAEGLHFKAVQIGGPSGGCVPEELANTSVDYESLRDVGTMMGSGGMVVLDESDCMVDVARFFLEFTQNQSCGKCTFCRIGTRRMLDILERLCAGQGKKDDVKELQHLAEMVKKASLCGLGKTAPNPVLSTIKYFRGEYEAHLQKRCPARRCKALIVYSITDDCIGCTLCAQHCPAEAIEMRPYEKHQINVDKCIRCGTCKSVCPSDAVEVR
jgi:NADH:ubiquinone oxidoreductase subunit F (NADH-binding)